MFGEQNLEFPVGGIISEPSQDMSQAEWPNTLLIVMSGGKVARSRPEYSTRSKTTALALHLTSKMQSL